MPLQSGDDRVLRAMQRRYGAATYLRRLEPLDDFNLTTDVIVGFPTEDEAAFARTIDVIEHAGISGYTSSRTRRARARRPSTTIECLRRVEKRHGARLRALSHELCVARWQRKTEDVVLVDRPGRGYGDDYTPWLVDAPVGELRPHPGGHRHREGYLARAA